MCLAGSSVRDRKKKGGGGWGGGGGSKGDPSALAGTREYEQAEGGLRCYRIWNVP